MREKRNWQKLLYGLLLLEGGGAGREIWPMSSAWLHPLGPTICAPLEKLLDILSLNANPLPVTGDRSEGLPFWAPQGTQRHCFPGTQRRTHSPAHQIQNRHQPQWLAYLWAELEPQLVSGGLQVLPPLPSPKKPVQLSISPLPIPGSSRSLECKFLG